MAVEPQDAESIRNYLISFAGWELVPDEVVARLMEGVECMEVKRKRSIFRRGEPGPGLFLVKSGEFKLSLISSEGREQILYLAEQGKMIGEGFLPQEVQCAASAFARPAASHLTIAPPRGSTSGCCSAAAARYCCVINAVRTAASGSRASCSATPSHASR